MLSHNIFYFRGRHKEVLYKLDFKRYSDNDYTKIVRPISHLVAPCPKIGLLLKGQSHLPNVNIRWGQFRPKNHKK